MTAYHNYHPNFRKRRVQVLAEFDNKCLRCGIPNRSLACNAKYEMSIVYLHIAHVFKHEVMAEDAYLIPLCARCHYYFDHPREEGIGAIEDWTFIGEVARHFIEQEAALVANSSTDNRRTA